MKYTYQARTKEGKIETGAIEASSKEAAAVLLQKYNIFVTSLTEESPRIFIFKNLNYSQKISKKDLAIFFRQLAVMLESRVPVVQSLTSLAIQADRKNLKEKIIKIAQMVDEGNSLSDAFSSFPETFDSFLVNLVKSGEISGRISESLRYLSEHLEREHDINSQVRGIMIYPMFVLCVLLIVITIVIFSVIPRISDLMKETTSAPPLLTLLMIDFYGFLKNFGLIILIVFFLIAGSIVYYIRTEEGKRRYDELSLRVPLLGKLLQKIYLIRFSENVSTLISAGLSINETLKITGNTIDNSIYRGIIFETGNSVSGGEKISSVLVKYPENIPPFVVQMIEVGEETGKLDKSLLEVVNFYQKEVKRAIETYTALLEPILIIILGIIVALLAISVLAPLYGALGTI